MSLQSKRSKQNFEIYQMISKKLVDDQTQQTDKNIFKRSIKLNLNKLPKDWLTPKTTLNMLPPSHHFDPQYKAYYGSFSTSLTKDSLKPHNDFLNTKITPKTNRSSCTKYVKSKTQANQRQLQTSIQTQANFTFCLIPIKNSNNLQSVTLSSTIIQKNKSLPSLSTPNHEKSKSLLKKSNSKAKLKVKFQQLQHPQQVQIDDTPKFKHTKRSLSNEALSLFKSKKYSPQKQIIHDGRTPKKSFVELPSITSSRSEEIKKFLTKQYKGIQKNKEEYKTGSGKKMGILLPSLKTARLNEENQLKKQKG